MVSFGDVWIPVGAAQTSTLLGNGIFDASPVTYTDTGATNAQQFYRIKSP